MDVNREDDGGPGPAGPVLYLDSDKLDPTEAFCSEIFDGTDSEEYRVVQLTSSRSFDSLQDAFDVQLENTRDPSEAAVIILSPQSEDDSTVAEVGEHVPLYGFWVDPKDLTGISVAFSRLIERWEDADGRTKICLRNIESLLPYHDTDLVYRFLNTVLATLQGAGADVHAHLQPSVADDRTLELLGSLFAHVSDRPEEASTGATEQTNRTEPEVTSEPTPRETAREADNADTPESATSMTAAEIDSFLQSIGHGVLALDGSPPYAIPMSYGYDAERRVLYLQLSAFDGSEKYARLADSSRVSFVVSRFTRPDQWGSVVVDGTLTPASEHDLDESEILDVYADSDLASVDVFTEDLSNITFEWHLLEPDTFSGRQSINAP